MNVNKSGQTHDQLQAACYKAALQEYHPLLIRRLISIPNDMAGGNAARARHYQALGVTGGVWDMCLNWFTHIPPFDQLWICPAVHWFEFKVGKDKLSRDRIVKGKKILGQYEFRETFLPLGHKFYIINEQEEFMQNLKNIVEPTLHIAKQIWNKEVK